MTTDFVVIAEWRLISEQPSYILIPAFLIEDLNVGINKKIQ